MSGRLKPLCQQRQLRRLSRPVDAFHHEQLSRVSCGVISLFNMCGAFLVVAAGDLESNGLAEHLLERRDVPVRGPQLELGVAVGARAVRGSRRRADRGPAP